MKLGILGAGAWGTALAQIVADGGRQATLWSRNRDVVTTIKSAGINLAYLPDVRLNPLIEVTDDFARLKPCDAILVAVPAQHMRGILKQANTGVRPLILCSKGIEANSQLLMSEVAREMCSRAPIAVLSGPTFAHEVARGLPTAVTLACTDIELARTLAKRIARPHFRPYVSIDLIGAEIGGAIKNVLAIACGVAAGLGLGENARAALIARGFAEMVRFGLAKGARLETLSGLAGMGDLVLTCSSNASRNFSLGKAMGEGHAFDDLIKNRRTVAEGAYTAPVLQQAATALNIEMPVVDTVCALIGGQLTAGQAVSELLRRPLRGES